MISKTGKLTNTYTIEIKRIGLSNDTSISKLSLDYNSEFKEYTPSFSGNIMNIDLLDNYLDNKYSILNISINSLSTYQLLSTTNVVDKLDDDLGHSFVLINGTNTFTIIVIAEDTTKKLEYTLNINVLSNKTELEELLVDNVPYDIFTNNTLVLDEVNFGKLFFDISYTISKYATISSITTNSKSSYHNNKWNLTSGLNELYINILAQDKTEAIYTIKVVKEEPIKNIVNLEVKDPSNNIIPFDIPFSSTKYEYNVFINPLIDFTSIYVSGVLKANQTSNIDISSNYEIKLIKVDNIINQQLIILISYHGIEVSKYKINIIESGNLSEENDLESIVFESNGLIIDDYILVNNTYTIMLQHNINEINIILNTSLYATINSTTNLIANSGNLIDLANQLDDLIITFNVVSQKGDISDITYEIIIIKEKASSVSTLDNIELRMGNVWLVSSNIDNISDGIGLPFDFNKRNYYFNELDTKFDRSYIGAVLTYNTTRTDELSSTVTYSTNTIIIEGMNEFLITVTGQDGSSTIYKIVILIENSDVLVDSIEVGDELLVPTSTNEEFTLKDIDLDYLIKDLDIIVNINKNIKYDKSKTTITFNPSDYLNNLKYGLNTIEIKVLSEDESKTIIYTLIVNVIDNRSRDNEIHSISLFDELNMTEYDFENDISNVYNFKIPFDVTNLRLYIDTDLLAMLVDVVGFNNLTNNENIFLDLTKTLNIEFKVLAENGDTSVTIYLNIIKESASSDASLSDLNVKLKDLSLLSKDNNDSILVFNSLVYSYEYIDNNKFEHSFISEILDLLVTTTNEYATYNISNKLDLNVGLNTVTIDVKAQDNITTKTYAITILIENSLVLVDEIEVDGKEIDLDIALSSDGYILAPITTNNIPNKLNISVLVNSLIIYDNYNIEFMGNSNFIKGLNTILIKVSSEDGSTVHLYTVVQEFIYEKSNDTSIDKIIIDDKEYEVDSDNDIINIKYPFKDGDTIDLDAIVSDEKLVSGNETYELSHGNNDLTIIVTAEDGTTKEYTIVIEALYDENYIEDIIIEDHELTFNSESRSYTINVSSEISSLDIDVLTHLHANITIINNTNLNTLSTSTSSNFDLVDGVNEFTVYATSEYGTKGIEYTIIVVKEASPIVNDNNGSLSTPIIILIIVLSILTMAALSAMVFIIIYRNKINGTFVAELKEEIEEKKE